MPPPTSSLKPGPGAAKANGKKSPAPANGASTPKETVEVEEKKVVAGKPDQSSYNSEQDGYNKEIAAIKTKLDAVRSRISLSQAPSGNDRRSTLKGELDALRAEQGTYKASRGKLLDEIKRLQEGVQKKIKDAQASKGKISYRNVSEIDERIQSLDKQIESGSMKLVDEKKALQEITTLRRSRKTLETSGSAEDAIAADKARIDDLRKQLDDPESRKASDKFDELKKEMDGLREEGNKAYEERGKLFDERNSLTAQMDELYGKKRESALKFREDNDKYYAKIQADRTARQERYKSEKAKEDAVRREEEIARLREEAQIPAFGGEIEDCQVLIGFFTGKFKAGEVPTTNAGGKAATAQLQGVKELEIRKVENDFKGMTLKKKGDDDEMNGLFGGSSKKGKRGKGVKGSASGTATPSSTDGAPTSGGSVNLPMSLLSALLALGIPPPSGKEDVPRVVNDLETKKSWFEANSAAKTKAEIERVEKLVLKMQKKNAILAEGDDVAQTSDGILNEDAVADAEEPSATPVEGAGAKEPTHTVAISGAADGPDTVDSSGSQLPTDASPTEEVKHIDSALEEIKENEES